MKDKKSVRQINLIIAGALKFLLTMQIWMDRIIVAAPWALSIAFLKLYYGTNRVYSGEQLVENEHNFLKMKEYSF